MIWDYTLLLTGVSLLPVGTLKSKDLAIEISMVNQSPTWHKAGYLYPLINVGGGDIPGSGIYINFGAQIVSIPYLAYKLRFVPVPYLTSNYTLKIFKLPMSISYPSSVPTTASSGSATTIAAATVSTTITAVNASRTLGGLIVNKSNRRLWIRFDALTATTAFPSIDIPANGGSIDIPDGYIGQITGIWESGATGSATLIEYIAV